MQKGMETIMLKQVAIFAENKKGTFQDITQILQNANINILGSVTNDGPEYGIMRLIVSDTEKALAAPADAVQWSHAAALAERLMMDRANVARELNLLYQDGQLIKIQGKPTYYISRITPPSSFPPRCRRAVRSRAF